MQDALPHTDTPRPCPGASGFAWRSLLPARPAFSGKTSVRKSWFVAAATSLQEYLHLEPDEQPERPEVQRLRKKWIEDRIRGPSYSETLDQPRLTARMDLSQCRGASPSFDKLCRDLERALYDARTKAGL